MTMARREFKGSYEDALKYGDGDAVYHYSAGAGAFYESIADNNDTEPGTPGCLWVNMMGGVITYTDIDAWEVGTYYPEGQLATRDGSAYVCLGAHTSSLLYEPGTPSGDAVWRLIPGSTTTTHADTHVDLTGTDPFPNATTSQRGLMTTAQVTTLEGLVTTVGDLSDAVDPDGGTGLPNSSLADMPAFTLKGNATAAEAPPADLTKAQVLSLLGLTPFTGLTVTGTMTGTGSSDEFLTTDGLYTWVTGMIAAGVSAIHDPVADIAALQAEDTSDIGEWPDACLVLAEADGLFRFDRDSTSAADGSTVIAPAAGPGRFIKQMDVVTNHNVLDNILGDGNYHISAAQLTALQEMLAGTFDYYTADQIKTLYEDNLDTNCLTDALKAKLDAIAVTGSLDLDALATQVSTNVSNISTNASNLTTHVSDEDNPHSVNKTDVGLPNVHNTLHNLTAGTAPTSSDDSSDGYSVGSMWYHGTDIYHCVDDTAGAAVWRNVSALDALTLNGEAPAYYLNRDNHTGTQVAATISDFATAVAAVITTASVTDLSDVASVGSGAIITDAEREAIEGLPDTFQNLSDEDIMTKYESNADRNAFTDAEKAKLGEFGAAAAYMLKSVYDPTGVAGDCFDAANIAADTSGMPGISEDNVQATLQALYDNYTTPGGSDTQLQYNNDGAFGGMSWTYDDATGVVDGGENVLKNARAGVIDLGSVSGTVDLDGSAGNYFVATCTGTTTFQVTNTSSGKVGHYFLEVSPGGEDFSISGAEWGLAGAPAGTASKYIIAITTRNGGTTCYCSNTWEAA